MFIDCGDSIMLEKQPYDNVAGKYSINQNWSRWFERATTAINFSSTPSNTLILNAYDQIRVEAGIMRIEGASAGTTTLTSDPQITAGEDGQSLTVEGMSDTNKVKFVNGNGLQLSGGVDYEMGEGDVISFHYNKKRNIWIENSRSNN
jgi:hypothetical protein